MARREKHNRMRKGLLARFRRDRRGVGAIEFAFIAPVMIVLYIGAVEVSVAMSVNKKLARASSTVADLLTQDGSTDIQKLESMVTVAKSIMTPYDPEPIQMTVTGIWIDESGEETVEWSWRANGGGAGPVYQQGDEITVPDNLEAPETFLLRSHLTYRHDMITSFPITGQTMTGIDMGKTYHLRPRIGDKVTCDDC